MRTQTCPWGEAHVRTEAASGPGIDSGLRAPEGTISDSTLALDFRPPELPDRTWLLLKPPRLGTRSCRPRKVTQGSGHMERGGGQGQDPGLHNFGEPFTNCRAVGLLGLQCLSHPRCQAQQLTPRTRTSHVPHRIVVRTA